MSHPSTFFDDTLNGIKLHLALCAQVCMCVFVCVFVCVRVFEAGALHLCWLRVNPVRSQSRLCGCAVWLKLHIALRRPGVPLQPNALA